jgi:formyl-CoA transferase
VIHTLPEAVSHPQAEALGIIQRVPGDDDATLIGLPLSFDGVRPTIRTAPPAIGQHDADLKSSTGWPTKGT